MNTFTRLLGTWSIVLLLSSFVYPQQAQDQQKPAESGTSDIPVTTLRARTDLVLVPVVVHNKNGEHIPNLAKEAFELKENGKEQVISLFEEVRAEALEPAPSLASAGTYSNLPFDNTHQLKLTIMVLDLLNTSPLQRADGRDQFIKFLSKGLASNQPVSLLCLTNKDVQMVHPFTSDSAALIMALKTLSLGGPTVMPRRDAAEKTLKQLTQIAQAYTGIPGRKTMIFAAGDIPQPLLERSISPSHLVAAEAFQRTFKSLIDANIAIYPFENLAWVRDPAFTLRADLSLRDFAESTGGNRCIESNDLMKCMAEAVEDSRDYYMLGFSVSAADRKPGWRKLEIKVSVEKANIRSRNGFYYGNPDSSGKPPTARDAEINALASPLANSAIPMSIRILPPAAAANAPSLLGEKKAVEFMITIPLSGIKLDPSSSAPLDLEVGAIVITRDPREMAEFLHPVHGNPSPELIQNLSREGVRLREKVDLLPGSYEVRCMVRDNNAARIGTVVFPVEVK
jgi:VWFA-related protein